MGVAVQNEEKHMEKEHENLYKFLDQFSTEVLEKLYKILTEQEEKKSKP